MPLAGLDISDRSVKYARFAATGSGRRVQTRLADFGEEEIPEGTIAHGVIADENALAAVLGKAADRAGRAFRSSGMVVSLPEEKSFLELLQLPGVPDDALAGAVRWGIEGQIPLAPEDMVYDYEEIGSLADHPDHRDAVITAFPKGVVAAYVRVIKAAGLTPVVLELESQAIARATVSGTGVAGAVIVLDMGRTRTSFIIVSGGAIIFTATVGVGGEIFERVIAEGLGVGADEAIRIKKEIGLSKTSHDGRLYAALLAPLAALSGELRRAIDYYRDHATHLHGASNAVDKIVLSGGDASLQGLDTYLASSTQIPVSVADPFMAVQGDPIYALPPLSRSLALAFTAPIGLALRGIRTTITSH